MGRLLAVQDGFTLTEVLLSVGLLLIMLLPALEALAVARESGRAADQRVVALGLARAQLAALASAGRVDLSAVDAYSAHALSGQELTGDPALAGYLIRTEVEALSARLRRVRVTVACECRGDRRSGRPVSLVTVIGGYGE